MMKRFAVLLAFVLLFATGMTLAAAEESSQPEILAVYYCPNAQILTGADQSKEAVDTVIFLYQDDSYVQYVDHDHQYEVYSKGSYECNFDWETTDWQDRQPRILTVHVQQIHDASHQLQPIEQTYDVNLDLVTEYCLYPGTVRTDLKLVAAFMQVGKQKLVKADGNEVYLSTIWFYYDDGSFQQYAVLGGHENMLFSCGDYTVTDGLFLNSSVLTIHRTQKYQDGIGLADYDSTHDYPIAELDFIRVYPAGED